MRVVKFNVDNIKEVDITKVVVRVKAFVINDNKVYIATSNGGCQLPGGHVEEGEDTILALIRELKEEMGIQVDKREIEGPFFEIRHYTKQENNNNKISQVLYYVVTTTKQPNLALTKYTEHEKQYNFSVSQVDIDKVEQYISGFITDTQQAINTIIAKEMLTAFDELKLYLAQEKNNG